MARSKTNGKHEQGTIEIVGAAVDRDSHFPAWDACDWRRSREHHAIDDRHAHAFDIVRYERT